MIGRASPDTRHGCGAMITIALFCSLSAGFSADAAEINLSDLRGYSIDAEWINNRSYTKVETSGQRKRSNSSKRFVDKIYISKTGRIFHRRQLYDSSRKSLWSYDNIRGRRSESFEWGPSPDYSQCAMKRSVSMD